MNVPPPLKEALWEDLGLEVMRAFPVGGGMINSAAQVDTADGPIFLKWKENAPPGFFAAEAHGLKLLRHTRTLRVPQVLSFRDSDAIAERDPHSLPYLALEFIGEHTCTNQEQFAARFGRELAALHRESESPFAAYGLPMDNFLGEQVQLNAPHERWAGFYRDRRLLPQVERAREKGLLIGDRERAVMRVVEQVDDILDDMPSRPCLIHGDLWSGNFLMAGDEPVVIDPAVYYADREVEMAYVELFGGFPYGLIYAYRATYPLDSGYEHRRPLHQLYPLLIHLNHFGQTYGPDVDSVCAAYGDLVGVGV